MALLYGLQLLSLMHLLSAGEDLSQSTIDSLKASRVDDCTPNVDNCWDPSGEDPYVDYTTSTIKLESITEENGACCYQYTATHDHSAWDCNKNNKALSHWNLGYICPETAEGATITVSGGGSLVDDPTTCVNGIKFETQCEKEASPCTYNICIEFSNHVAGKCCADEGWYLVKAGTTSAVAETLVPKCTCPTSNPSRSPTKGPTRNPSVSPTKSPSQFPTKSPTKSPSQFPTVSPTLNPTKFPTISPTENPSASPTKKPTENPTKSPTKKPTKNPSKSPTRNPSISPTLNPSKSPTRSPTVSPSKNPTQNPTKSPTKNPTKSPTKNPTKSPTKNPTVSPTVSPSKAPTKNPSVSPTKYPTPSPTAYCRPIVEIWVNKGCESANIELDDTDIWYAANIQEYDSLNDVGSTFNTQPGDTLSQTIFTHACSANTQQQRANAPRPYNMLPMQPLYGNIYHDDNDEGFKNVDNVVINDWDSYHIGLLIYSFASTAVLLMLCAAQCGGSWNEHPSAPQKKGFVPINGVDEDDGTDDEENEFML